jgi:hypothetical protein
MGVKGSGGGGHHSVDLRLPRVRTLRSLGYKMMPFRAPNMQVGVMYVVQATVSDASKSNVATTNITVTSAGVALSVVGGTGYRDIGTLADLVLDASPTTDLDRYRLYSTHRGVYLTALRDMPCQDGGRGESAS